jgi:hypothetical protein
LVCPLAFPSHFLVLLWLLCFSYFNILNCYSCLDPGGSEQEYHLLALVFLFRPWDAETDETKPENKPQNSIQISSLVLST